MSRSLLIALAASFLLHAGIALSGYLVPEPAPTAPAEEEIPVIALDLPPPPEPEEPETFDNQLSGDPSEESAPASLAPPMLNDAPSAVLDSPFVQPIQPPPPPGLDRSAGDNLIIPVTTRPSLGTGKGLGQIFDLSALEKHPVPTFQARPQYPFELRRAGINGEVVVRFIVDSNGNVRDPRIIRSTNPAFEAPVLNAVLKWKFRPGEKGGVKVNTSNVEIRIPFNLNNE